MSAEVQLRAAATAAFSNAESILEDVRLLYAADRWARSVSLSIIGKEELGKSVIYAVAALDRLPGLRDLLASADFDNPTRDHRFKQLAAEIASVVHFMLEDLIYDSDGMAGPATDTDWVDDVLKGSAEWLSHSGVLRGSGVRQAFVKGYLKLLGGLSLDLPSTLLPQKPREDEAKKWRGLYVDISDEGIVHDPSVFDEHDARMELVGLETDVRALSRLPKFFRDDDCWSELDRTPVNVD